MTDQNIINLRSADPFADVTGASATESTATGQRSSNLIHIRIQQRSGKKTLTTVQVNKTHNSFSFFILIFTSRALAKNLIRNFWFVHWRRNLHVTVQLLIIRNMAKWFNYKGINVPTLVNSFKKSECVQLSSSKCTAFNDNEKKKKNSKYIQNFICVSFSHWLIFLFICFSKKNIHIYNQKYVRQLISFLISQTSRSCLWFAKQLVTSFFSLLKTNDSFCH